MTDRSYMNTLWHKIELDEKKTSRSLHKKKKMMTKMGIALSLMTIISMTFGILSSSIYIIGPIALTCAVVIEQKEATWH